jgi:hypothetical protein
VSAKAEPLAGANSADLDIASTDAVVELYTTTQTGAREDSQCVDPDIALDTNEGFFGLLYR